MSHKSMKQENWQCFISKNKIHTEHAFNNNNNIHQPSHTSVNIAQDKNVANHFGGHTFFL